MYVDLNPVRAKMCDDLAHSDFTSIQERIQTYQQYKSSQCSLTKEKQPVALLPFSHSQDKHAIAFSLEDYLELADWSGRAIHPQKRGYIDSKTPKLIDTLGITEDDWIEVIKNFRRHYGNFAGTEQSLRRCANEHHHCWYKGVG
ncbi:MAG: hypothetical protein HRU23_18965 [Gammaproteobacteria bacterium]|nr:hypothetical protein [Gammaproteobacteria bacterium]